jgi:hypothetical protein
MVTEYGVSGAVAETLNFALAARPNHTFPALSMRQKGAERRGLGFDTIVQGPASEGPLTVAANWATMVCVTVTQFPADTDALIVRAEG